MYRVGQGIKGYSLPTISPLFAPPPYEYRDGWSMMVTFRTDPHVLTDLVPEPLVPNADGDMWLSINRFFASGFGSYNEPSLGTPVAFKERAASFFVYLILDNDIAIGAGREIWGFPKKFGRIEMSDQDGVVTGTVERGGITLVTAAMEISKLGSPEDVAGSMEWINLKLIPSVTRDALPEVMQLTSTTGENVKINRVYKGMATLKFGVSPADPFHEIPILEVLGGFYYNSDFTLAYGEVIHDYLKKS